MLAGLTATQVFIRATGLLKVNSTLILYDEQA